MRAVKKILKITFTKKRLFKKNVADVSTKLC